MVGTISNFDAPNEPKIVETLSKAEGTAGKDIICIWNLY
jgi:hypothetical protein